MATPLNRKPHKVRLDRLLADRGLVDSREKGQALIIAGSVLVDGRKIEKAGTLLPPDADVRIVGQQMPYVSRGGLKLEAALREFAVDVGGRTALDVGASTGGFTDCLLQHGAGRVFAVDVGYGQLAWKLRQDPRVVVIERANIRELDPALVPVPADIAVIDVSFISLEKVLPAIASLLAPEAELIALIKPQFEVGRAHVGKGGIVRDAAARLDAVERIRGFVSRLGWSVKGIMESPLTGQDGNVEYLLYAVRGGKK